MPLNAPLFANMPADSELHRIAFVPRDSVRDQEVWFTFPSPFLLCAVKTSLDDARLAETSPDLRQFSILLIPQIDVANDDSLMAEMRLWVEGETTPPSPLAATTTTRSLMTSLQGAHIFWGAERIAILASRERLDAIRNASLEVAYFEGELRSIERQLIQDWPALDADIPQAFEVVKWSPAKQQELRNRFQNTLRLSARLARVTPFLIVPHVYPPTIASQVGERLRERARVQQRLECAEEQLEVFEQVYEMCSERLNDFRLNRSSLTLEWIIIVLLSGQLILALFEILTAK